MKHGVELGDDGSPRCLHFGMLRLLEYLMCTEEENFSAPEWVRRFFSPVFAHRREHFKQCFSKFDRAARQVARCEDAVRPWLERYLESSARGKTRELGGGSDYVDYLNASTDLPLYLDGMLLYLRIQADAYASLVPFFYPGRDEGKMPQGSFSSHLKWFTKKYPNDDPAYTSILVAHHHWFDRLAGDDPKGLRDVLIHQSGLTQTLWVKQNAETPFRLRAGLYRNDGLVEEDLSGALREITVGWFAFLDEAWGHFVPRLTKAGVLLQKYVDRIEMTRYLSCKEEGLPSLWVYPTSPASP